MPQAGQAVMRRKLQRQPGGPYDPPRHCSWSDLPFDALAINDMLSRSSPVRGWVAAAPRGGLLPRSAPLPRTPVAPGSALGHCMAGPGRPTAARKSALRLLFGFVLSSRLGRLGKRVVLGGTADSEFPYRCPLGIKLESPKRFSKVSFPSLSYRFSTLHCRAGVVSASGRSGQHEAQTTTTARRAL